MVAVTAPFLFSAHLVRRMYCVYLCGYSQGMLVGLGGIWLEHPMFKISWIPNIWIDVMRVATVTSTNKFSFRVVNTSNLVEAI